MVKKKNELDFGIKEIDKIARTPRVIDLFIAHSKGQKAKGEYSDAEIFAFAYLLVTTPIEWLLREGTDEEKQNALNVFRSVAYEQKSFFINRLDAEGVYESEEQWKHCFPRGTEYEFSLDKFNNTY